MRTSFCRRGPVADDSSIGRRTPPYRVDGVTIHVAPPFARRRRACPFAAPLRLFNRAGRRVRARQGSGNEITGGRGVTKKEKPSAPTPAASRAQRRQPIRRVLPDPKESVPDASRLSCSARTGGEVSFSIAEDGSQMKLHSRQMRIPRVLLLKSRARHCRAPCPRSPRPAAVAQPPSRRGPAPPVPLVPGECPEPPAAPFNLQEAPNSHPRHQPGAKMPARHPSISRYGNVSRPPP